MPKTLKGNCYVACEALYHLLGGKASGWTPINMRHEGVSHWALAKKTEGYDDWKYWQVLDPTVSQFKTKPNYEEARGRGFLTKKPSKRAKKLMTRILYQKGETI